LGKESRGMQKRVSINIHPNQKPTEARADEK